MDIQDATVWLNWRINWLSLRQVGGGLETLLLLLCNLAALFCSTLAAKRPGSAVACLLASLLDWQLIAWGLASSPVGFPSAVQLFLALLWVTNSLLGRSIVAAPLGVVAPIAVAVIPSDPLDWWFPLALGLSQIGSIDSSIDLLHSTLAQMGSFFQMQNTIKWKQIHIMLSFQTHNNQAGKK